MARVSTMVRPEPKAAEAREIELRLLDLHGPAYQVAVRVLGSAEGAEDVVQQAYLKALRQVRGGTRPESERAWFLMVVANGAKNHLRERHNRRRREMAATQDHAERKTGAPAEGGAELVSLLRKAMETLDEKYRVPLALCYEQQLSQREAAMVLSVPESTLADRLTAGLERLRHALKSAGYAAAPAAVVTGLAHTAPTVPAGLGAALSGGTAAAAVAKVSKAGMIAVRSKARIAAAKAAQSSFGWQFAAVVALGTLGLAVAMQKSDDPVPVPKPAAVAPSVPARPAPPPVETAKAVPPAPPPAEPQGRVLFKLNAVDAGINLAPMRFGSVVNDNGRKVFLSGPVRNDGDGHGFQYPLGTNDPAIFVMRPNVALRFTYFLKKPAPMRFMIYNGTKLENFETRIPAPVVGQWTTVTTRVRGIPPVPGGQDVTFDDGDRCEGLSFWAGKPGDDASFMLDRIEIVDLEP